MSLKKCYAEVLDLPVNYAIKEANQKLSSTYMFLNGALAYISDTGQDFIEVVLGAYGAAKTLTENDVTSLAVWLPKTGVYFKKGTCIPVLLYRKPNRQWKRSYSHAFYEVEYLEEEFATLDIDPDSWHDFWVAPNGSLKYMGKTIGYIKDSTSFVCTMKGIEQELIDWMKGDTCLSKK